MTNTRSEGSSFRTTAILLLLLSLPFSLFSCKSKGDINTEHELLFQTEDAVKAYYFIIPHDASAELVKSAEALAKDFSERFDLETAIYYDSDSLSVAETTRLFLIGNTSYEASQKAFANKKRDDRICMRIEDVTVLGGKSNAATVLAIEEFMRDVLPHFDTENGLSESQCFEYLTEYPYNEITVNGYSLSAYSIVYPESGSMRERELAYILRERLSDICGAYPDIYPDTAKNIPVHRLCIGGCFGNSSEAAKIYSSGTDIFICGYSVNSLAEATERFITICTETQKVTLSELTFDTSDIGAITLEMLMPDIIDSADDLQTVVSNCKSLNTDKPTLAYFGFESSTDELQYKNNLTEYTSAENGLFILTDGHKDMAISADGEISVAALTLNDGISYTVIAVNAYGKDAQALALSAENHISKTDATLIFTLYDGTAPAFSENGLILSHTLDGNGISLLLTVYAPSGSATVSEDLQITLLHPIFKSE